MSTVKEFIKDLPVKKLYRDLMRMAQFMGQRHGTEASLMRQVREAFKRNMQELDDDKIVSMKEDGVRALNNIYFQEAERLARASKDKPKPRQPNPPKSPAT